MLIETDSHAEHLRAIGWQGDIPSEIHCEDGEYDHVYHSWKRSLPHADHDTLHTKSIGTIAWKHHGPIGTKDVPPHIVQDAKLTESRAIKNHLREADLKHFPALKKELDDIEDAVKDGTKELVGLRADSATAAGIVGAEVRVFQAGVEKLAEDSRQDLAAAVKLATKFGWAIVALLSMLILCTLFAPKAHAQFSKINSITFQQDGSDITGAFFSYPFTINCTVNVTCSIVSGKLTINSTGGGSGSPCVTSALSLQFNNAGAFGCVTGSSVSGGSINLASGNVFSFNADLGISRSAANQLALGNGTAGNASGFLLLSGFFAAGANGGGLNYTRAGLSLGVSAPVMWGAGAADAAMDTSISRLGAASIAVGNGTAGDFSGAVKATTFTGALTGNATTATALAANPTNCSAGNYPLGIDASGNVESCTAAGGGSTPTGTGFTHVTAGVQDAASVKVNLTASTDVAANQGTTTTVLHGNAAGQTSFGAVVLTADVSGVLPIANGGTGAATVAANTVFQNNTNATAAPSFGAPACSPMDRTTVCYVEEFGTGLANTSGQIGMYGWTVTNQVGGSAVASQQAGVWPAIGIERITSAGTASSTNTFQVSQGAILGDLSTNTGWIHEWTFRLNSTSNDRIRIGQTQSGTSTVPTDGAWFRFDNNGALDSVFKLCGRTSSGTETCSSSTLAADNAFHTLRIRSTTAGTWLLSLWSAAGVAEIAEITMASGAGGTGINLTPTTTNMAAVAIIGNDTTASSISVDFDRWSFFAKVTR